MNLRVVSSGRSLPAGAALKHQRCVSHTVESSRSEDALRKAISVEHKEPNLRGERAESSRRRAATGADLRAALSSSRRRARRVGGLGLVASGKELELRPACRDCSTHATRCTSSSECVCASGRKSMSF